MTLFEQAKASVTLVQAARRYGYCVERGGMDNAYKPLAAKTVSMTLKKYSDEFHLDHDNHILNALGKRVNGFWGIEPVMIPSIF